MRWQEWPFPPLQVQCDDNAGGDEHRPELGQHEEPPLHTAIFGLVAGNKLGIGLHQIERRPIHLCRAPDHEYEKPQGLQQNEWELLSLNNAHQG